MDYERRAATIAEAVRDSGRRRVVVDRALHELTAGLALHVDAPPAWMKALFDTLRALRNQEHVERRITGLGMLPRGGVTDWHEVDYVAYVDGQARFDVGFCRHLVSDGSLPAASPDVVTAITCPMLL